MMLRANGQWLTLAGNESGADPQSSGDCRERIVAGVIVCGQVIQRSCIVISRREPPVG